MTIFSIYRSIFTFIIVTINVLTLVKCWKIGDTVNDVMTSLADKFNDTNILQVQEIDDFETVVLLCRSNGKNYMFMYWVLPKDKAIVGPSNEFNRAKYNYEVLSGNLTVRHVMKADEGIYHCISKGVYNNDVSIRSIRMVVNQRPPNENDKNFLRGVAVLTTLVIVCVIIYVIYCVIKRREKKDLLLDSRSDDEDSGDEIFSAPTTSLQRGSLDYIRSHEIDNDARMGTSNVSIDFEDILQNHQS